MALLNVPKTKEKAFLNEVKSKFPNITDVIKRGEKDGNIEYKIQSSSPEADQIKAWIESLKDEENQNPQEPQKETEQQKDSNKPKMSEWIETIPDPNLKYFAKGYYGALTTAIKKAVGDSLAKMTEQLSQKITESVATEKSNIISVISESETKQDEFLKRIEDKIARFEKIEKSLSNTTNMLRLLTSGLKQTADSVDNFAEENFKDPEKPS